MSRKALKSLSIALLVVFFVSGIPAQEGSRVARAKPLNFFGNNLSDWVTISFTGEGGNYIWNILENENTSPPGPDRATIASLPWGRDQLGMTAETGDWFTAFGDYTGDGRNDLVIYRGGDVSPLFGPTNTGGSDAAASLLDIDPAQKDRYWIQPFGSGAPFTIKWGKASEFDWSDSSWTGGSEGDYDGDGIMDATIVRNNNGVAQWWILNSSDRTVSVVNFGNYFTDSFLPGADYDGDGKDDPAVFRVLENGQVVWYAANTSGVQIREASWGNYNTDWIIPAGDYDGDGRADFMVWRALNFTSQAEINGIWYLLTNTGDVHYFKWGIPGKFNDGDYPLRSGDYDGDGKTDIAIWRSSTQDFWVRRSSDGQPMIRHWGRPGDVPLARWGIY